MLINNFFQSFSDILKPLTFSSVLDAGCGEGFVMKFLHKEFPRVPCEGIDLSEGAVRYARTINPEAKFCVGSISELPFPDNSFDLVLAMEILEHLYEPEKALRELSRTTRRFCLVSVPREPFFTIAGLLSGRHLKHFGHNPEHVQMWGKNAFCDFVGTYFTILSVKSPFPWTIALLKKK